MDRPTDRGTDKAAYRVACTRLKNRTQLKEKLLFDYPDARDKSDGGHVVFTFPQGMKKVMKDVLNEQDQSYKVNILAQAAKIVRTEALAEKHALFTGIFESKCQECYMPTALKTLVSMVVGGVNINAEEEPQSHLTIAQIILFDMKRSYTPSKSVHHRADREPPVCTYVGMKIHTET